MNSTYTSLCVLFLCGWLACGVRASPGDPPILCSWPGLDEAVGEAFAGLTNSATVVPPGEYGCGVVPGFYLLSDGCELESGTNLFRRSLFMDVPVWSVRVIETQTAERVWIYEGGDGSHFRTNDVPPDYDAEDWVNAVYGTPPGWMSPAEESQWYNRRDRSRLTVTLLFVRSNNWEQIAEAWDGRFINSPPSDPSRIAFAGISVLNGAATLELYAPTNPLPIEIYSSGDPAAVSLWSFAGSVKMSEPFGLWLVTAGSRGFYNAVRADMDADSDGLPDGREILVHGTDPLLSDGDDDGLSDSAELYRFETDPGDSDCDNDSIPDGWEALGGLNPFDPADIALDMDGDHLYNIHEYWTGTDPLVAQTNASYAIADAMGAVDGAISGRVASAGINIFSVQNHSATNYVRNTNCWAYAYDLSCCSPWNSYSDTFGDGDNRAGTLISPRHVLFAAHYDHVTTNDLLRFVDRDNGVIERRLIAKTRHPDYPPGHPDYYPDLTVGLLDSDVPTNRIGFALVLPDDWRDFLGSGRFLPALCLDQEEKALIADVVDIAQSNLIEGVEQVLAVFDYPADDTRLEYSEEIILGDSGNPAFIILDGRLVLLCVWTYGDAGAGTSVTGLKDDINQMMNDLGGGYQLTEIDLAGYSGVREAL